MSGKPEERLVKMPQKIVKTYIKGNRQIIRIVIEGKTGSSGSYHTKFDTY